MSKKLKVFHGLVNYGTQAGILSQELRNQGVCAFSLCYNDSYKRKIDKELLHGGNLFQKIIKHTYNLFFKFSCFCKYNTFHFYFGTSLFPFGIDLKLYRFFGKKVIMEYLGWDVQLYQFSIDKYEITNASFYKNHSLEIQKLHDIKKKKRLAFEKKHVDIQLVCAPYLSEFVVGSTVLPLAIDLKAYTFVQREIPTSEIVIMHAPTSEGNKGTKYILESIKRLTEKGYVIKMIMVNNVSHDELKNLYSECDIFIDQIIAGWYGTASIEAMATGCPTVCFLRESYFTHITYGNEIPIINAQPNTLLQVLEELIENKNKFPEISLKSRKFVEDIHDSKKVTAKLLNLYGTLWSEK